MENLQFRKCTTDDQDEVIDLWAATSLTKPWNDPVEDFSRAVTGQQSAILVGILDDKVVSCVMVGEDGHRGWIYYFGVRPEHQGRGLGRRTLQEAELWFGTHCINKVNLLVRAPTTPLRNFYRKVGYRRSDVICMQKKLKC